MLEKLVQAALARPAVLTRAVEDELARLETGGYLKREELEKLTAECVGALQQQLERAKSTTLPLVAGLGATLREALDIPSRAEIVALTEALRRAEAARNGPGSPPSA